MESLPNIEGLETEEATDVWSIGGLRSVRVTRGVDGNSVLFHEIDADTVCQLHPMRLDGPKPDFAKPFITPIYGPVHIDGKFYLVEKIPRATGLIEVWQAVLVGRPQLACSVLRALLEQLNTLAEMLREAGAQHEVIHADNIILADGGVYGLLKSSIEGPLGPVFLRPRRGLTLGGGVTGRAGPDQGLRSTIRHLAQLAGVALPAEFTEPREQKP